jgi:hypothetical protein
MSFSQSLNVEDYLLYKEFEEFKKYKQLQDKAKFTLPTDTTPPPTDTTPPPTDTTPPPTDTTPPPTDTTPPPTDNTPPPTDTTPPLIDNISSRAIQSNSAMTAYTMQDMISLTPLSVLDSQVQLNQKVVSIIDTHFTDTEYNDTLGNVIKFAKSFTYSQDISGQQSIMVPSLSLVNIPSFSFSSFNFNVSLEGRGTDTSKNLLVSPTLANSKFAMYNINGQMLDRGEPIGLTRLKILLSETIIQSSATPAVKKGIGIRGIGDVMFDTTN